MGGGLETLRVAEAIIAAAPDFRDKWEKYGASDMFGPDEPYNHLAQLAHHLVSGMKAGKTDGLSAVFSEVEDQLATANAGARDLIIVGFLEDLQNISLNGDLALRAWLPWLGQRTARSLEGVGGHVVRQDLPDNLQRIHSRPVNR